MVDVDGLVGRLTQLLSPSGHVFVSLPGLLGIGPKGRYANILLGTLQNAHVWYPTLSTLRWLVERRSALRLRYGDERIWAVFTRSGTPRITVAELTDESSKVLAHLQSVEAMWWRTVPHWRLKRVLDAVGMLKPLQGVRHALGL